MFRSVFVPGPLDTGRFWVYLGAYVFVGRVPRLVLISTLAKTSHEAVLISSIKMNRKF